MVAHLGQERSPSTNSRAGCTVPLTLLPLCAATAELAAGAIVSLAGTQAGAERPVQPGMVWAVVENGAWTSST
jgi:hypothetical protein